MNIFLHEKKKKSKDENTYSVKQRGIIYGVLRKLKVFA